MDVIVPSVCLLCQPRRLKDVRKIREREFPEARQDLRNLLALINMKRQDAEFTNFIRFSPK